MAIRGEDVQEFIFSPYRSPRFSLSCFLSHPCIKNQYIFFFSFHVEAVLQSECSQKSGKSGVADVMCGTVGRKMCIKF